jgi:glycosyltransferase involved in cell wall biosynthesis
MVGTDLDGKGGIRAAIRGLVDVGLFQRFNVTYVATHRYGSLWGKMTSALGGWLKVAYYLCRLDAPLVHVQASCRASFWRKSVVCFMARVARRPYILHVHSGEFIDFYRSECGPLGRYMIRRVFANARLVIALSEPWRERLLEICPAANVDVLSNSVALPDAATTGAAEAAPQAPTLLYLGFIKHAKGTDDLVRAFARIAGKFPTLELLCGGTGSLEEMRQLAASLGVGDRVSFPGWLGPERKREAMRNATIFILPSYAEGMPMSLMEAMAWGLPTIATPVGDHRHSRRRHSANGDSSEERLAGPAGGHRRACRRHRALVERRPAARAARRRRAPHRRDRLHAGGRSRPIEPALSTLRHRITCLRKET